MFSVKMNFNFHLMQLDAQSYAHLGL